jgi:hypothetical protein
MFTDCEFRRVALALKDVVEGAHMGHPDFRASGRIFATLHADGKTGMVALTPEQQREFIERHGAAFRPAPGAWGRQGATLVTLAAVDEEIAGEAMTLAWQNAAARVAARSKGRARPASRRTPGRKR